MIAHRGPLQSVFLNQSTRKIAVKTIVRNSSSFLQVSMARKKQKKMNIRPPLPAPPWAIASAACANMASRSAGTLPGASAFGEASDAHIASIALQKH
jgi:hypothetical protein